jgi:hypothetical protein
VEHRPVFHEPLHETRLHDDASSWNNGSLEPDLTGILTNFSYIFRVMADVRPPAVPEKPSFGTAFRYWLRLGFVNFGGPAGQIALMYEDLVAQRPFHARAQLLHAPPRA